MIRIKEVKANKDFTLLLTFTNNQKGVFDVKPYLIGGKVFEELNDPAIFNRVKANRGTIEWPNGADLCPDCVYQESKIVS